MSKYVIRGYHWGYNDETFYPSGSYIKTVYDNEDEAKKEKLRLERDHWSQIDLGETDEFFNADSSSMLRANEFILQKTGKVLFEDLDDPRDTFIPGNLSDEDFAEFLNISGLEAYKLTFFEDEPTFYALWCCPDEEYFKIYDECSTALGYGSSINELQSEFKYEMENYLSDHPKVLSGSLSSLSDTPSVLSEFITRTKGLSWSEKDERIKLNNPKGADILALNDLLKTPFFRVDKLSLEELQKLLEEVEENCFE